MWPGASPMLPVAFSGQARFICESGDHGGRPEIEKTYVAVLQHKQRIRGDPRKPVGSNKSNVFVIKNSIAKHRSAKSRFWQSPLRPDARGDLHVSGWSLRVRILIWG